MNRLCHFAAPFAFAVLLASGCAGAAAEGEEGEGNEGEGAEGEGGGEGEGAEGEGGEGEGAEGEGGGGAVTWYRDVLPVARARCEICHVEGGIGPFSIEDESAVVIERETMQAYVETREMPPWMPSNDCGGHTYQGDKSLSAAEIALFTSWGDNAYALGDAADANGDTPALDGLARIDLDVAPAQGYTPQGSLGNDDYHCFLVDPGLGAQKFVTGTNIIPGTPSMVHHVLLYAVNRQDAIDRDNQDAVAGWTCFGGPDVGNALQVLATWAPGSSAVEYPVGTGIALPSSEVIVMQVHYNFDAAPDVIPSDLTHAQLQLEDNVTEHATLAPLIDQDFQLTGGVQQNGTPSNPGKDFPGLARKVYGVLPHMHQLGTTINVTAANQGCLVDIPQWDFHWQQSYFFSDVDFVQLGFEQVKVTCTWDNETGQTVTFGENTTDEMCLAFVYINVP